MIDKKTSIQIHAKPKERLAGYGSKGETFEEIIIRLMDYWDQTH